jgi:3-dehydroquinate synthase
MEVVEADPEEHGIRKSLNFGHTIGHALESESLHAGKTLPHGFAVAFGMIVEAELSKQKLDFSSKSVDEIAETVTRLYGNPPDTIRQQDILIEWMKFDKKNRDNRINFTLLEKIGICRVDQVAGVDEIREAMETSRFSASL